MSEGGYVRVGTETSYGAGDGTMNAVVVTDINDNIDKDPIYEESIDSYVANAAYQGGLKLSGSIEGNLRPLQWLPILSAAFGTSVVNGDDYDLSLGSAGSTTLEIGTQTSAGSMMLKYVGTAYKTVKISAKAKELVKISADWFAKNVSKGTYSQPTASSEDPVMFQGATLKIDTVASTKVREFSLNIDRGFKEDNYVLGSAFLGDLIESGVVDMSGSIGFTAKEYDEIYYAIFDSTSATTIGTCNPLHEAALELVMIDPCTSANKMTISLPVTVYPKVTRRKTGRDETQKMIDFKVIGSGPTATIFG